MYHLRELYYLLFGPKIHSIATSASLLAPFMPTIAPGRGRLDGSDTTVYKDRVWIPNVGVGVCESPRGAAII